MAAPLGMGFDQFLNLDQFDQQSAAASASTSSANPSASSGDNVLVHGDASNYAELFRQYLAPEVAKLPNSFSLPPLPALPSSTLSQDDHPFALSAPENDHPTFSPTDSFSPSAFMPMHVPGSPIGAFSPSSDNSGSNRSPVSFGELELEFGQGADEQQAQDWSIDPSIFGATELATVPEEESPFGAAPVEEPEVVIKEEESLPVPFSMAEREQDEMMAAAEESEDEHDESEEEPLAAVVAPASSNKRKASSSSSSSRSTSAGPGPKQPKTSVAAFASATLHPTSAKSTLPPVPEWTDKPDPDEYKKLSSKEKRQLRNKISARNFRHRRKEYITDLEAEISTRDTIIEQLRDEVGTMRVENKDLRSEVTLLKQKWDEMMEKMTSFTNPAAAGGVANVGLGKSAAVTASSSSAKVAEKDEEWALDSPKVSPAEQLPSLAGVNLPALPVASTSGSQPATRRAGTRGASGIVKPNLQKDVAPSLKRGTGSWTTAGMGGGYMPVHTTILPEFNLLNAKPIVPFSTQNFNPALNNLTPQQRADLPSLTSHLRTGFNAPVANPDSTTPPTPRGTFDNFFESNPLWLRADNIDEYRGQLYGKVANNVAGAAAANKSGSTPNAQGHLPLPTGFRPAFFQSSRSLSPPAALLSGKEARDINPTSDLLAFQNPRAAVEEENRRVAGLAASTLFSKMTGAFFEAFAGTVEERKLGMMSSEKVASVLSGRSSLQVVPNELKVAPARDDIASLGLQLGGLDLSAPASPASNACSFDQVCKTWMNKKGGDNRPGTPTA
ncbi:bZIP transcription factor [Pseudohyphozyma bogoriensis]|nr:bZIP transcription factor [Pseudohyphozyma bogoriensis]